jgi:glycosyltransferase involved in cell wall biosynthesis
MEVYHIGTIAFESEKSKRETKSIGGISSYIAELINYSMKTEMKIGLVGKIFNYQLNQNFTYIKVQNKITSTNIFLIKLFIKSITAKIHKKAIIHAHRPDHLSAFILLKNRKSVLSLHGQQALTVNIRKGKLIRSIYKTLERYAFRKADALIAVDSVTEEFYAALYPKHKHKLLIIPTGVDTQTFRPFEREICCNNLGFNISDKIIIYVGRIEPPKKVDTIIKAFRILVDEDITYKLVLVGDGVLMNSMKSLSSKLQLSKNIIFLGVRKRNELPQLFSSANASILISGNEGSPLSVKESLACGVPVIANNVGDISEIIKDSLNGYIVDPDNVSEIVKKIRITVNDCLKMKQACIDSIQEYKIESVYQKVLNVYKNI